MRSSVPPLAATPDPRLTARVVRRTPLFYVDGADAALDRPGHVRAGSGVARFGDRLVVVQDDANFLAFVDPATGETRAVPLPAGADGRRQFDDGRGNKHHKLDLEAVFAAPARDGRPLLVALGSWSTSRRELIVTVTGRDERDAVATVHDAGTLYAALRADPEFAPGELNVEGAALRGGLVQLMSRGNGAARGDSPSRNSAGVLNWEALRAYLEAPAGAPPGLERVRQYDLGQLDGLPLGFTDAAVAAGDVLLFSAAAEDSPDATRDGLVTGSVLGVIDPDGSARWTPLRDPTGTPLTAKVEGIVPATAEARRLFAVVDLDDPTAASELWEVELEGPWTAARPGS